ncbi:murein transglycosylase A [Sphingomicrobium clamense]|uniref:murein transglycosylase A n=1 Tax=Sphingomicrobium clamense TaxID=2851013 RepID=UPI002104F61C|nr:murein transglycosylase A [Sphingomicrobium sp. B8]
MRWAATAAAALILSSCSTTREVEAPAAPVATTAAMLGFVRAPVVTVLQSEAEPALAAFSKSCEKLILREDASGLTTGQDWIPLCAMAASLDPSMAANFFASQFTYVRVGDGTAFATGYFEPEIEGCREPRPGCDIPIYAVPDDLTRGTFSDGSGEGRGRTNEAGEFVLFHDRAAIEAGALAGRGLEIAYAKDAADLFFLHIQGSGRVRMDDESVLRIGYASQNGREYIAIGRLLRERGIMAREEISMQSIKQWIRDNPEAGAALMRENKSYIFFRVLEGEGPLGAMEVAVTPGVTVAADPKFVPLGAPVFLDLDDDRADGFWIAQDTGGAIKGANRFDTFWGAGAEAAEIAGSFAQNGTALVLIPKSAYARAQAQR